MNARGWWQLSGRVMVLFVVVVGTSLLASYRATRAWRQSSRPRRAETAAVNSSGARESRIYPSGRYLIAYTLLSSQCGVCRDKRTRQAIEVLRDSLRARHSTEFAAISVVGVAIDDDLSAGVRYLRRMGGSRQVFDELSVGGSWLNEFMTTLVWRDGMGRAEVPQVLLVTRHVNALGFPRFIDVQGDSLLLNVPGRDSLIAWVNNGTPIR